MKRVLMSGLVAGIVISSTSQAHASSLILDSFDADGPFLDLSGTTGTVGGSASGAGILGGERDIAFSVLSNPSHRSAIAEVSDGQFILDTGPSVLTSTLLTWNGPGSSGLNTNLLAGGLDAFSLEILDIDLSANLKFIVTDGNGGVSQLAQSGLGAGQVFYNFSDFLGTANFADVSSISLMVTAPEAIDLTLDLLEVVDRVPEDVPEPTGLLGALALVGVGKVLLKRKLA
jgi:hypothetical protein